jgi:hypothetical protein
MKKTRQAMLDSHGRKLKPVVCKVCGYEMDAASCTHDERRPKPGDASICLKCGELYMFDEKMRSIEPSIEWLMSMPQDARDEIGRAQLLARSMRLIK